MRAAPLLILSAICTISLAACSEPNLDTETAVSSQGTIDLKTIKLGTPDQVFQEATVTFVRDPGALANSGGKRQYLSRPDAGGGQYVAQVKNGSCFEISIIYKDKPVSRDFAEAALMRLLPDGAPPQSRVDEKTEAGKNPEALYFFGDEYLGDLSFVDKTAKMVHTVKLVNMTTLKQALADSLAQKEALKPLVTGAQKEKSKTAQ